MGLQQELQLSQPPEGGHALSLSLLLTREILAQLYDAHVFRPAGLTDQQYNVLRIVKGGPPEGWPVGEIKRRLLNRHADAPRLVDRMVAMGLLRRAAHPSDRRSCLVQLTPAGLLLLEKTDPAMEAADDLLAGLLEAPEASALVGLLDRLREGLRLSLA